MDSPATLLTILTTLIGYMAIVAVIFKLFQIASELSEIKELLAHGHSPSSSSGKGEDSATHALGLESVSYAESLLRSVKAQEETDGYKPPVSEGAFAEPYAGPRTRAVDPPSIRTKTALRQIDSVGADDPWRERPRESARAGESARAASPELETAPGTGLGESAVSDRWNLSQEKAADSSGKWTREGQREKRATSLEHSAALGVTEALPADKTSSQLTALNSSVVKTSPERRRGAPASDWNSPTTVSIPVSTPVTAPVTAPAMAPVVETAAVTAAISTGPEDQSALSPRTSIPLYTSVPTPPPPIASAPSIPAVVPAAPAAESALSAPAPALPASAPSEPVVPSLENAAATPALSPLASSVPNVMGSSASISLPPENPTRASQPKVWPPEPVTDEALPMFLPASDKTIDWNAPLD